jgi:hypothetical protein
MIMITIYKIYSSCDGLLLLEGKVSDWGRVLKAVGLDDPDLVWFATRYWEAKFYPKKVGRNLASQEINFSAPIPGDLGQFWWDYSPFREDGERSRRWAKELNGYKRQIHKVEGFLRALMTEIQNKYSYPPSEKMAEAIINEIEAAYEA